MLIDLVRELSDKLYDKEVSSDDYGPEGDHLYLTTNGYLEAVYWMDFCILDEDSDRGWNEETGDYERSEKQQIIYEFKKLRQRIDNILNAIEED